MAILKGQQIFSHLEGQESLPAKLYSKAIRQARLQRSGENILLSPVLEHLPITFGTGQPAYVRRNTFVDGRGIQDDSWKKRKEPDLVFDFTGVRADEIDNALEEERKKKEQKRTHSVRKGKFSIRFKKK